MKVVQINAVYDNSSTGRNVKELDRYLKENGYSSYVFYSVQNEDSNPYELIGTKLDHKFHGLLSRLFGKQGYFSRIPTRRLIKKLDSIKPDVVLLHNFHSNYISFPLLVKYLAKKNIATILILHDCWFFTGHCCHYTEIGCLKWQNECNHCPLVHSPNNNRSWFFDNSQKVFNDKKRLFSSIPRLGIVGVSDWITDEGRKAPIFEKANIYQRIYNWIDLKSFYPRETTNLRVKLGLNENDFIALGVSMLWDDKKGLNTFIQVAEFIPDIKIIMIGNVNGKELPNNIMNIKPTSSIDELAEYYSIADVLFNFSMQETFGKVAAEALACGTPLIVNNATANPEIPGECGFVVNVNDIASIKDKVEIIRNYPIKHLQNKCVQRAASLFEMETNLAQYVDVMNKLIEQ